MRNDKNVPKAQRVTTKPFINIYTSAGRDIAHFKVDIWFMRVDETLSVQITYKDGGILY